MADPWFLSFMSGLEQRLNTIEGALSPFDFERLRTELDGLHNHIDLGRAMHLGDRLGGLDAAFAWHAKARLDQLEGRIQAAESNGLGSLLRRDSVARDSDWDDILYDDAEDDGWEEEGDDDVDEDDEDEFWDDKSSMWGDEADWSWHGYEGEW